VTPDVKILPIFRCFLLAVTCFFYFFQNFKKLSELDAGRHVRVDFHVNRSGNSLEIRAREKKEEKKAKFSVNGKT